MWILLLEAGVALALLGGIVWASWPRPDRQPRPLRAPPESPPAAAPKPEQEASDESGKS